MELAFGEFRLDTSRKMLWRGQSYVPLGDRSYAILSALLASPGNLVTKAELFQRAWPGLSVEPANLRVQIANLRKVLGEIGQEIITEQSLGYRFNVSVRSLVEPSPNATKRFRIPGALLKPLGREMETASILQALTQYRLVSIVGPGGIGKTTLALEIASLAEETFQDGVCFVDLSLITDPGAVAIAVASALERPVMTDPSLDVRTYLRTRQLLLVLDCCERVIEASAELADAILADAPGVKILSTSREAMRVTGEWVERLEGLSLPSGNVSVPEQALGFGAIALFSRTAKSANSSFELKDDNLATVTDICRKLDGIPLAIDLAAGMSGSLGLEQIHDGLAERMYVLAFGRRGGLPRHRTLEATIAWSYEMLEVEEIVTLRRLSIFADSFTMGEALDTVVFEGIEKSSASLSLVSLAQKSLLNIDRQGERLTYRLLETTRHFASAQLTEEAERRHLASSHANHMSRRLSDTAWDQFDVVGERQAALGLMKEVREALDWSYSNEPSLSVELTLAAERLLLELGLYAEHSERMTRAKEVLERSGVKDDRSYAAVLTGISYGTLYETMDVERINIVFEAMRLSEALGEKQLYMRNVFYAYYFYIVRHRANEALEAANIFLEKAREANEEALVVFATITTAIANVQLGNWRQTRETVERYIHSAPADPPRSVAIFFGFNIDAVAHFILATVDCMEGDSIRAFELIEKALVLTEENRHEQTRFQVLFFGACCLSFVTSDWARARHYLDLLDQHARNFAPWQFMTTSLKAWLAYDEGRLLEASSLLEPFCALDVPSASMSAYFFILLSAIRRRLGDLEGAERLVEQVLARKTGDWDPFMVGWALKARGDNLVGSMDPAKIEAAAAAYNKSIEVSRHNRAIVLEIPAAAELAKLEISRGNLESAKAILNSTVARAPKGPDLSPMAEIKQLLASI